ncbi:MAG: TRAP transporter permease [Deltaproteobacteria bacterium]|jgi:TRAP transporter 4TM/12TM fusion protein|nr:TRAP transporter permease [Deltaproteobacteria bacterium]
MNLKDRADKSDVIKEFLERETGRRKPTGIPHVILIVVPIIWSLFQLWIVSPIPYTLGVGVLNDTAARSFHLAFSVFLAFVGFPMFKKSPVERVPLQDWLFAVVAAFCSVYLYVFQTELSRRPGLPTTIDVVIACVGVILLLEATRRVMGFPMTLVAITFLLYVFGGPYAPRILAHGGTTLSRAASQFWLTQEGVFGLPLGVSTSFVFLYVLFGALLEGAGAANYLTALSFALLGRLRGGPAKAAVVASGFHGFISGSSIANVLTTGPITIMLMKKVGFTPEKAGAVEVAASSNGQIMPPVMGAAAFLMAEYINMPYSQLIKHAFIPAMLAYLSLLFIVHLEACKLGLQASPGPHKTLAHKILRWGLGLTSTVVTVCVIYYVLSWVPGVFGDYSWIVFAIFVFLCYLALLIVSLMVPELPETEYEKLTQFESALPVILSGLFYLLPTATLVWGLMVMEMSPGLAAYYACLLMIFIVLTHRPFVAWRKKQPILPAFKHGVSRLMGSFVSGAKNMIGIGLATASAGIVVGTVSLTGVGLVLASMVEYISGGFLPVALVLTAMLSIILGMGLPTTANYIIVSTLLSPVIFNLSAAYGLGVPLLAVHLFCLYFGVMADATPPVALAAFAASGISGGNPFKTGVQGFIYELRTAVLPFVFLYNQEILLLNIKNVFHLMWVIATSLLACMAFASATHRFFLVKTRWWELIFLLGSMVFLFRPDIPHDAMYPPYHERPPEQIMESVEELKPDEYMRLHLLTTFRDGRVVDQVVVLPVRGNNAQQRLSQAGVYLGWENDVLMLSNVGFSSRLEKLGVNMDDPTQVLGIEMPNRDRPAKWMFSSPGLLLLLVVVLNQIRRRRREISYQGVPIEASEPAAS